MGDSTKTTEKELKKTSRRPWAFPLGVLIFALAVFGALTLLNMGLGSIRSLTDKTALKAEYEEFLAPVVRNDPQYYEDLSKANNEELLDSAIWLFLKDGGISKKEYEISESDPIGFIVPTKDLEWAFVRLFGGEFKPSYETVYGPGYIFTYDVARSSYIIAITSADPLYLPKVYEIEKHGSSTLLIVGYINSHKDKLEIDKEGNFVSPEPDKYVKVTLRKTDAEPGYYVSAIEGMEAVETAEAFEFEDETTEAPIPTLPEVSDPSESDIPESETESEQESASDTTQ